MPDLCVNGNEEFKRVSMHVCERMYVGEWESLLEHFIKDFLLSLNSIPSSFNHVTWHRVERTRSSG